MRDGRTKTRYPLLSPGKAGFTECFKDREMQHKTKGGFGLFVCFCCFFIEKIQKEQTCMWLVLVVSTVIALADAVSFTVHSLDQK